MVNLYKIQNETIKKIIQHNQLAIFNECGTGKTITILTAMKLLQQKFLVVCPLSVLDWWVQEASKVNMNLFKIYGKKRLQMLEETYPQYQGFILNYDGLKVVCPKAIIDGKIIRDGKQFIKFIKNNEITTLICDESTFVKHRNDRWKILKNLAPFFNRRYILTGTPITNSIEDIWSQIYLLDFGERFKSLTKFREKYMYLAKPEYFKWEAKKGAEEEIAKIIAPISVRYKLSDIMKDELPEATFIERYIYLDKNILQIYYNMLKNLVAMIDNTKVTAFNIAVAFGKLLELTSGFVYDNNGNPKSVHTKKIDAIQELLEGELYNKSVIIYHNYNHERFMLENLFSIRKDITFVGSQESSIERQSHIEAFQNGKVKVIVIQSKVGGFGLNLQKAEAVIWFSPPLSLEVFEQANSRVIRIGQIKRIVPIYLITSKLVDYRIYQTLKNYEDIQRKFLEIIREEADGQVD
jgi:SNF2 family DNA or RNA helicase